MRRTVNNKGFVMIETIIVISILAVGLLSLYSSYVIISKRNSVSKSDTATNTYIAYQISNSLSYGPGTNLSDPYYVEIYKDDNDYYERVCGKDGGNIKCVEESPSATEVEALLSNLNISKVYFIKKKIADFYDGSDILLLFDGSTIDYLNSIKNDVNIKPDAQQTVIVKTSINNKTEFSYYQKSEIKETKKLLREILGDNNRNVSSTVTIPGAEVSAEDEKVLAATLDDYGISYYYRGAVDNNYIVFAKMCWRIVRVTGNNAIKLVLYNYNSGNAANPCAESEDDTSKAFVVFDTNYYNYNFSRHWGANTYVGFMYSNNPNSNDYNTAHANDEDNRILYGLKRWYDTNSVFTASDKGKLADVIWCNDISPATSAVNAGVNTTTTTYSALYRLSNGKPSLVCPNAGEDGKLSKFTARDTVYGNAKLYNGDKEYKIGLLTADEVQFAGGSNADINQSYYLYENASAKDWWTMSPGKFDIDDSDGHNKAWVITVKNTGDLGQRVVTVTGSVGVRPAIALVPTVSVTGEGTSSNPYVVED